MAKNTPAHAIPEIFNEIIRKRVSDYIEGELNELIKKKVDAIITDVLANLQADTHLFRDMMQHETRLVVRAIYKGEDITQKGNQIEDQAGK